MTSITPLPSRLSGAERRIPEALDLLEGPDHGVVRLPVRLAWSGLTEFEVSDSRQRLTLYRTLLDCGQGRTSSRTFTRASCARTGPGSAGSPHDA